MKSFIITVNGHYWPYVLTGSVEELKNKLTSFGARIKGGYRCNVKDIHNIYTKTLKVELDVLHYNTKVADSLDKQIHEVIRTFDTDEATDFLHSFDYRHMRERIAAKYPIAIQLEILISDEESSRNRVLPLSGLSEQSFWHCLGHHVGPIKYRKP